MSMGQGRLDGEEVAGFLETHRGTTVLFLERLHGKQTAMVLVNGAGPVGTAASPWPSAARLAGPVERQVIESPFACLSQTA